MLLLLVLVAGCEAGRVLSFVAAPFPSHHRVLEAVLAGLAARGHHVTSYTPFPVHPTPNYTQVLLPDSVHFFSPSHKNGEEDDSYIGQNVVMRNIMNLLWTREAGLTHTQEILTLPQVRRLMSSNETYDLIILESSCYGEAYVALQHKFKALTVEYVALTNLHWANWLFGSPYDTSYIAEMTLPFSDKMTFLQRVINTMTSLLFRGVWMTYMPKYEVLMDKYMRYPGWEERPSMLQMLCNTSLVLVNSHPALTYPYPLSPHFKEIGGVNIQQRPPLLPKSIAEFMDNAEHGVIYFSLGTNKMSTQALSRHVQLFIRTFSKLKQRVLWKSDVNLTDLPENVRTYDWLPQQSLLAHKNMKLFITQGGYMSVLEAINYKMPMLGIPVWADQVKNVGHMEYNGYGIGLYPEDLSEQSLLQAISELLSNNKYKEMVMRQRDILRDRRTSPVEEALYWIEYVLRHQGAPHLRPSLSSMSWIKSSQLDVFFIFLLVVILSIYIIQLIFKQLYFLWNNFPVVKSLASIKLKSS